MQSQIPKIAAICLATTAVAFMGMSIAGYYGRPDPMAEIMSPELQNYKFEAPLGTDSSWSVTPSVGTNTSASSHATAYAAIMDAYKKESARLKSEISDMSQATSQWRERINELRAQQQEDVAAVDRRIQELNQENAAADLALAELSDRLQKRAVQTTAIRNETSRRREDVVRLQHELEELRTDRYRLQELRRLLTDRLVRLQLENQALDVRFAQLQDADN